MAEEILKPELTTVSPTNTIQVVHNEIQIRSIDRTAKTVGTWRDSHKSAESVYSPQRYRLYDHYADAELDGHLSGIMGKRIDAVLNKTWIYLDKAGKKVDAMDATIRSRAFREIKRTIMLRKFWGVKGMEFIPGPELAFKQVPVKHIKPELGLITIEQTGNTGILYADVPNLWVLGDKDDFGLLLKCTFYAILKKGNWGDWAQYIEIFGQPVRVMYYDLHDKEGKAALRRTLDESGSSLALMLPKGVEFDLKDGKQSNGDGKLQDTFKRALNEELSVLVLGNTETTTNGGTGSQSKTVEHNKQQLEVTMSDLTEVADALNSPHFQAILRSYGLPVVEGGMFTTQRELDLAALKDRVDIDAKLAEQVPVDDDYWYETYGIPKPANYDELKAKQEAARAAAPPAPGRKGKGKGKEEEDLKASLNWLERLRLTLADFFDPAPES